MKILKDKPKLYYFLIATFILLIVLYPLFATWLGYYSRLCLVRKNALIPLQLVSSSGKILTFGGSVEMTADKLYFHNSYPRLVICVDKKFFSAGDIGSLNLDVRYIAGMNSALDANFTGRDFKLINKSKILSKSIGRNWEDKFFAFYPVGMPKLSPGNNEVIVSIGKINTVSQNEIKISLVFHETSNVGILWLPLFKPFSCCKEFFMGMSH